MTDKPCAMVILASEQLWPNIQGLVHWHRHEGGIEDLLIYYTGDGKPLAEKRRLDKAFK